ncbi:hypothetical protein CEXT_686291 [Caerostris extrusa]|uniref:Uncharacterized protein n=1 Tax=Caerostris extrusa TaxID=172846 RepID=A0AAV4YDD6_CAEEX|nr:hypothetical protein CEXT_686291 [Caerostris extrusa]
MQTSLACGNKPLPRYAILFFVKIDKKEYDMSKQTTCIGMRVNGLCKVQTRGSIRSRKKKCTLKGDRVCVRSINSEGTRGGLRLEDDATSSKKDSVCCNLTFSNRLRNFDVSV